MALGQIGSGSPRPEFASAATPCLFLCAAAFHGDCPKLVARAALQKHIPQLVLTPVEHEGKPVYRVSGEMDISGDAKCVMEVVARDGLEPPTPAFSGPRSTN